MSAPLPPVIDVDALRALPGEVVVADVRWYLDGRSGRAAHAAGHLPGAVWVDVDTDLSAPPDPAGARHPLPDPDTFAAALGRLGIGDGATVVAYDDAGGAFAARLVWLLRRIGTPAALLDGGPAAWPGPLETGPVEPRPAVRTPVPWPPGAIRTADDVAAAVRGPGGPVVLDARAADRFSGASVLPTDVRSGHVPGARSAPWAGNLGSDGRFVPAADLRERYAGLGIRPGTDVVVYCGSGVTACHDLLALELAGISGALYPGSWSEWSADPARPVATGEDAP
ncbi:sulfurtransferase [Pseudonocardia nematodicida]|uniref:Sulfurtransferase n=1 Tax=Pseudonocardia nematodicida TaxID=1206997 RepID=A0ABV1KHJ2_9PSEU